ncbi:DUF2817 domain-containing protein [Mycolicibacterium novocastrense]|nr:DUF2817 domain-containing protein [Mycolicibacterium novocastrense]
MGTAIVATIASLNTGCDSGSDTPDAKPVDPPQASSTASPVSTASEAVKPAVIGAQDWEVVGVSVQGRPIRARSFGHGPRTVLFIGGIHGDETEGVYTTKQLPGAFEAADLGDDVTLTILEDANPDGRAASSRGNANGVDVNRNFPASNFDTGNPEYGETPLSQPESKTLVDVIDRSRPDLVIVSHAWAGDQFINFDGPARGLAERFSASSGFPVQASSAFASTPGSLGPTLGVTAESRSLLLRC